MGRDKELDILVNVGLIPAKCEKCGFKGVMRYKFLEIGKETLMYAICPKCGNELFIQKV